MDLCSHINNNEFEVKLAQERAKRYQNECETQEEKYKKMLKEKDQIITLLKSENMMLKQQIGSKGKNSCNYTL